MDSILSVLEDITPYSTHLVDVHQALLFVVKGQLLVPLNLLLPCRLKIVKGHSQLQEHRLVGCGQLVHIQHFKFVNTFFQR